VESTVTGPGIAPVSSRETIVAVEGRTVDRHAPRRHVGERRATSPAQIRLSSLRFLNLALR
jgi:hypothetical protein